MTRKEFFTNPLTIIVGAFIVIGSVIWIGKRYWGWFGGNINRQNNNNCQCTKTKGQCGRDQYCDGCNCVTENNATRKNVGCNSDADCPRPHTHCGEEKLCVYDESPNGIIPIIVHPIVKTTPINPRPTPTPARG